MSLLKSLLQSLGLIPRAEQLENPPKTNSEPEWLSGYTGQSTDELIALEGRYRTDSLVVTFESALQQKAERLGLESLSTPERVVLAVEAIERQVNNGGYDQFFVNSSNQHAAFAVEALRLIGCELVAELTQAAIDLLEVDGPLTVAAIEAVIHDYSDTRDDAFGQLDSRYYSEAGDLATPLFSYIKANRGEIVISTR